MATELETIAAAVVRSTAASEKTLALVTGLSGKLDDIRKTTTDPATAAALLSLAVDLNAESDKVEAAEAAGEAELADAAPSTTDSPAPAAGEDPGSPGTTTPPTPVDTPAGAAPVADPTV